MKTHRWHGIGLGVLVVLAVTLPGLGQRSSAELQQQRRNERMLERERRMNLARQQNRANRPQMPKDFGMQKALGVTESQWKGIEPHVTRIRQLMGDSNAGMGVMSSSAGGGTAGGGFSSTSGGGRAGGSVGGSAGGGSMAGGSMGSGVIHRQSTSSNGTEQVQEFYEETNMPTRMTWGWRRPSAYKQDLTPGEKACEELLNVLEDKHADPGKIQEKIATLKRVRQAAREQIPQAQEALRRVLDSRQQAIMTLMGYL